MRKWNSILTISDTSQRFPIDSTTSNIQDKEGMLTLHAIKSSDGDVDWSEEQKKSSK